MAQEQSRDQEAITSALKRLTKEVHTEHSYKPHMYRQCLREITQYRERRSGLLAGNGSLDDWGSHFPDCREPWGEAASLAGNPGQTRGGDGSAKPGP